MVKRNSEVKPCPEKWQTRNENFDIVFTYEMSVFDAVRQDLETRRSPGGDIVRVFDLDVEDTHEDSMKGALDTLEFMKLIDECYTRQISWEDNIDSIIAQFTAKTGRNVHYAIYFARL